MGREQSSKVKRLFREFNKNKRQINILKCQGSTIKARRYFWGFISNNRKDSLDITSVLTNNGTTTQNPTEIIKEIKNHITKVFEATEEPNPIRFVPSATNDHEYPLPDPALLPNKNSLNDHIYANKINIEHINNNSMDEDETTNPIPKI